MQTLKQFGTYTTNYGVVKPREIVATRQALDLMRTLHVGTETFAVNLEWLMRNGDFVYARVRVLHGSLHVDLWSKEA